MNEKIKAYSSTVTAIFSALVVLYGVFKFINTGNETARSQVQYRQEMDKFKNEMEQKVYVPLDSIRTVLKRTESGTERVGRKVDRLTNQFTFHLSRDSSVTKQDLRDIINELNEKKN